MSEKNLYTVRVSNRQLNDFIKEECEKKNITFSKFICDALRDEMNRSNFNSELSEINKKVDTLQEKYNSVENVFKNLINIVISNYGLTSVLLQGLINKYKTSGSNPYNYFTKDVKDIKEKFSFSNEEIEDTIYNIICKKEE